MDVAIMANYGFCFCPVLARDDCSGFLHLWVDCRGMTDCTPTPYDVKYEEWDAVSGQLYSENAERRIELTRYSERMAEDLRRIEAIVRDLGTKGHRYTTNDILTQYQMTTV